MDKGTLVETLDYISILITICPKDKNRLIRHCVNNRVFIYILQFNND